MLADARRSLARELVLEAVAEQLGIEVSDDELRAFIREQAELSDEEDPGRADRAGLAQRPARVAARRPAPAGRARPGGEPR